MPNPAPWLIDDEYDAEPAEALMDGDLGRFACNLCADNRDAAERTQAVCGLNDARAEENISLAHER